MIQVLLAREAGQVEAMLSLDRGDVVQRSPLQRGLQLRTVRLHGTLHGACCF